MTERDTAVLPTYEEWLERVSATYQSVAYCCLHRLYDRAIAEEVSLQVVAGLIGKPKIFKYFGLPYSGRIARLAERGIAEAKAGTLGRSGADWPDLFSALVATPETDREVLLLACVLGYDDAQLASALGCDQEEARSRRQHMIAFFEDLSRRVLPAGPGEEGGDDDGGSGGHGS